MRWPDKDEIDGETEHLFYLVINGWDWSWPGWGWVARRLNAEYGNDRSAEACRKKFSKEYEKSIANHPLKPTPNGAA